MVLTSSKDAAAMKAATPKSGGTPTSADVRTSAHMSWLGPDKSSETQPQGKGMEGHPGDTEMLTEKREQWMLRAKGK